MLPRQPTKPKSFTVEQANATLPLVRAITADLAALSREVFERQSRLQQLTGGREVSQDDPYGQELAQVQEEVERQSLQLREYVRELESLGVEPRTGPSGLIDLVDFPSEIDGRPVFLCWRLGEPEVLHWHHLEAGFAGRQPLTVDSCATAAGPGGLDNEDDSPAS